MSRNTERISAAKILARGALKRCPRCSQPNLFRRWTELIDACPCCGLVFEQEEGYWVGALTVNTVVTLVLFGTVMLAAVFATWPETPTLLLTVIGVLAATIFPLLFYPFSKTLWVALDLAFFNRWRMKPGTGLRKTR
jgi:uncharacterized protein (DUF983 family)